MSFGSFVSGLFKSSSIPAIDHENFEKACKEGMCQAGSRSARALQQAHAVGRTDVVHYADGTSGWIGRGGSVER